MPTLWSANNTPVMVDAMCGHTVEILDLQQKGQEWWVLADFTDGLLLKRPR